MNDATLFEYLNHISTNRENKRPPTSKKVVERLKKFKMTEKYCKDNFGKFEFPNCAICINDIQRGEETILLPCGHMYHCKCIVEWLNQNNTCPVCRFELK
jgi:E3 ubiquitin-protein ligase RNF115/126